MSDTEAWIGKVTPTGMLLSDFGAMYGVYGDDVCEVCDKLYDKGIRIILKDNLVWKIQGEQVDPFSHVSINDEEEEDGSRTFVCAFYNGSTCLEETLMDTIFNK